MFFSSRFRAIGAAVALCAAVPGLLAQALVSAPSRAEAGASRAGLALPASLVAQAPTLGSGGVVAARPGAAVAAGAAAGAGAAPALPLAPQAPSWAQALDAAWARSAESVAALAAAQTAGAEQAAARAWLPGAPVLEVGWRTDQFTRNAGARESELGVALPLWLPGQRLASAQQAEAAAALAQASASAQRVQLAQALLDAAAAVQQQRLALVLRTAEVEALRQLEIGRAHV